MPWNLGPHDHEETAPPRDSQAPCPNHSKVPDNPGQPLCPSLLELFNFTKPKSALPFPRNHNRLWLCSPEWHGCSSSWEQQVTSCLFDGSHLFISWPQPHLNNNKTHIEKQEDASQGARSGKGEVRERWKEGIGEMGQAGWRQREKVKVCVFLIVINVYLTGCRRLGITLTFFEIYKILLKEISLCREHAHPCTQP